MENALKNFNKQFAWTPEIQNPQRLKSYSNFVVGGMGGSHLSAGLLQKLYPGKNIFIHRDYGLPEYTSNFLASCLFIASSYSGNTEETVDFARAAIARGYAVLVVTTGGALLRLAAEHTLPYILLPNDGLQPRVAIGYSLLALATVISPELLPDLKALSSTLDPLVAKREADKLLPSLRNHIPVIYTARPDRALGYNWKIKFNETAKIPAFCNVFPELNHNEMQGYDFVPRNQALSTHFHFIFLSGSVMSPRLLKRQTILAELYRRRGLGVTQITMSGETVLLQIFNTLLIADWLSVGLAHYYGVEPEAVPLIEDFKRQL